MMTTKYDLWLLPEEDEVLTVDQQREYLSELPTLDLFLMLDEKEKPKHLDEYGEVEDRDFLIEEIISKGYYQTP